MSERQRSELEQSACSHSDEMTDEQRWTALGEPEIICADRAFDAGCMYIGPDNVEQRVCEVCGADEPEGEPGVCPECGRVTCRSVRNAVDHAHGLTAALPTLRTSACCVRETNENQ